MLPHVVIHTAVSIDARIDWFSPDVGLYYQLITRWKEDATLAGSGTILSAPGDDVTEDDNSSTKDGFAESDVTAPLLVVPDSKGRIRTWDYWRTQPYWRDLIVLGSKTTSQEYLDYLEKQDIKYIIRGDDYVDLRAALEELNDKYGIEVVRVDSGGTLNGVLLRAGLVDEVSVLIHPSLVGGTSSASFLRAPDLTSIDSVVECRLIHCEKLQDDIVWLIYEVKK